MDELFPLLIFIVVVAVNALKFFAEKAGKKPPSGPEKEEPRQQGPKTIEDFFAEIKQTLEPEPRELPEWPEHIDRPDYAKEMEAYETAQTASTPAFPAEDATPAVPEIKKEPPPPAPVATDVIQPKSMGKTAGFRMPAQSAAFAGMGNMRIAMPTMLRSTTGHIDFELKSREQLKQALVASMVFGPPRAYDTSFNNTMAQ